MNTDALLDLHRRTTTRLVTFRMELAGIHEARLRSRAASYLQASAERITSASGYSNLSDYNSVEHDVDIAQVTAQINCCLDQLRMIECELQYSSPFKHLL